MTDKQDELLTECQRLFCQHCKALQKTNETVVECWYNPLDDEKEAAFCAANEDAVSEILAKAKPIIIREERERIIKIMNIEYDEDGCPVSYPSRETLEALKGGKKQ